MSQPQQENLESLADFHTPSVEDLAVSLRTLHADEGHFGIESRSINACSGALSGFADSTRELPDGKDNGLVSIMLREVDGKAYRGMVTISMKKTFKPGDTRVNHLGSVASYAADVFATLINYFSSGVEKNNSGVVNEALRENLRGVIGAVMESYSPFLMYNSPDFIKIRFDADVNGFKMQVNSSPIEGALCQVGEKVEYIHLKLLKSDIMALRENVGEYSSLAGAVLSLQFSGKYAENPTAETKAETNYSVRPMPQVVTAGNSYFKGLKSAYLTNIPDFLQWGMPMAFEHIMSELGNGGDYDTWMALLNDSYAQTFGGKDPSRFDVSGSGRHFFDDLKEMNRVVPLLLDLYGEISRRAPELSVYGRGDVRSDDILDCCGDIDFNGWRNQVDELSNRLKEVYSSMCSAFLVPEQSLRLDPIRALGITPEAEQALLYGQKPMKTPSTLEAPPAQVR